MHESQETIKENAILWDKVGCLEKERMEMMWKLGEIEWELRFEKDAKWELERRIEKVETEVEEKIEGIMEKNSDELDKVLA